MEGNSPHEHWHLKKEITWGHLMSTFILVGALIGLYVDDQSDKQVLDKRISVIEVQQQIQQRATDEKITGIQKGVDDMNKKVDRLIELQLKSGGSR